MKKNYHTGPQCISPKAKVTAWGKNSSFWAAWRINKSWNLYPTKKRDDRQQGAQQAAEVLVTDL